MQPPIENAARSESTLDSTFSSTAKLTARDWQNRQGAPTERQALLGRWWMVAIALLGNLPLFSIYLGDKVGPAIIQATTISGTMVMGLAPIFLLSFIRKAGSLSFHLAFWPGLIFGIMASPRRRSRHLSFPHLDQHRQWQICP